MDRSRGDGLSQFKDAKGKLIVHLGPAIPGLVKEMFPAGSPLGNNEWRVGNIQGDKSKKGNGSFAIYFDTGSWHEFNGGQNGDFIQLWQTVYRFASPREALIDLSKRVGFSHPYVDGKPTPQRTQEQAVRYDQERVEKEAKRMEGYLEWQDDWWQPRSIPVKDVPAPRKGVRQWIYHTPKGRVAFVVKRYDDRDGAKKIWIETPARRAGRDEEPNLIRKGMPINKRPIYNLHKILQNPKATIILVEGEKAAEAVQLATAGSYIASTWHGGHNALKSMNLSRLAGRNVILWPDADEPGRAAMKRSIEEQVKEHAINIVGVVNTSKFKEKFDAADFEDPKDIRFCIARENLMTVQDFMDAPLTYSGTPEMTAEDVPAAERAHLVVHEAPIWLGADGERIYYMQPSVMQINSVPVGGIKKGTLQWITSSQWWLTVAANDKGKVDWDAAVEYANSEARKAGSFSPDKSRQRGCWRIDDSSYVIHWGEKAQKVKDGVPERIIDLYTAYQRPDIPGIYVRDEGGQGQSGAAPLHTYDPASDQEMNAYCDQIMALNWQNSSRGEDGVWKGDEGRVYFGWLYMAAACGAYSFRPSIWVTGESGTGKSTILNNGSGLVLEHTKWGLTVDGGMTTPTGTKQQVDSRAIPVILDEMEPKRHNDNLEQWMALMRSTSYTDAPAKVSGSPSGKTRVYNGQSCFQFTSITSGVDREADASRLLFLRTGDKRVGADSNTEFDQIIRKFDAMKEAKFPQRFIARAVRDVHRVKKAAKMIERHLIEKNMSRRRAEMIAILEAAYYCGTQSADMTETIAASLALNGASKVYEEQKTDTESVNLLSSLAYMNIEYDTDGALKRTILRRALADYYEARVMSASDAAAAETQTRLFRAMRDVGVQVVELSPDQHTAMPKPDSMARYVDIWPGNPSLKRKLAGLAHGLQNTLKRFGGVSVGKSAMGKGVIRLPVDSLGIYDGEKSVDNRDVDVV